MPEVDFDINVTPLYDAIGKSDWDSASQAILLNPIEAKTWVVRRDSEPNGGEGGENGDDQDDASTVNILWRFLPLHSACARDPHPRVIRELLNAYPEAASLKDASGMYALHYACGNRASAHVIKMLIERFPQAVRESDPQGMLPLHYVCQWGPSEDGIVESLLEVFPEGAMELNGERMSPLDLLHEGNFEGWEGVKLDLMGVLRKKKKSKQGGSRVGRGYTGRNNLAEIEKEDEMSYSSDSSAIEKTVESSISREQSPSSQLLSTRSLIHSHTEEQYDSRDERLSSRSQRERSRSRREVPPSHSPAERVSRKQCDTHCDLPSSPSRQGDPPPSLQPRRSSSRNRIDGKNIHDIDTREISTMGKHHYESQSIDSKRMLAGRPQSISCSPIATHDMKTPRSSGRGPGFHFGQKTPRSSRQSGNFEFEKEPLIQNHQNRSQEIHNNGSALVGHLSQENERLNHLVNHMLQEKDLLQKENTELRAKLANSEGMQTENAQLRAKLANYETIQNENAELHVRLTSCDSIKNENAELRVQLDKVHDIESRLSEAVDISEQYERARIQASTERRKKLSEMLAMEEKNDREGKANFEQKIKSIGCLLSSVSTTVTMGGAGRGNEVNVVRQHYNGYGW